MKRAIGSLFLAVVLVVSSAWAGEERPYPNAYMAEDEEFDPNADLAEVENSDPNAGSVEDEESDPDVYVTDDDIDPDAPVEESSRTEETASSRPSSPVVIRRSPVFLRPPELGFYVAAGVPYDLFFISNGYYLNKEGIWYEAPHYSGPWTAVPPRLVPPPLRRHGIPIIRRHRDKEHEIYRRDRYRYPGRYFLADEDWKERRKAEDELRRERRKTRDEMRREYRKERHEDWKENRKDEHERWKARREWEKEERKHPKHPDWNDN